MALRCAGSMAKSQLIYGPGSPSVKCSRHVPKMFHAWQIELSLLDTEYPFPYGRWCSWVKLLGPWEWHLHTLTFWWRPVITNAFMLQRKMASAIRCRSAATSNRPAMPFPPLPHSGAYPLSLFQSGSYLTSETEEKSQGEIPFQVIIIFQEEQT